MTIKGGKKDTKKVSSKELLTKTGRAKKVVSRSEGIIAAALPGNKNEPRLETLAMIHHVHGGKTRGKMSPSWHLTAVSRAIDDNWSLWRLSWSVLWRVAVIIAVVRLLAVLTVIFFGNIILSI